MRSTPSLTIVISLTNEGGVGSPEKSNRPTCSRSAVISRSGRATRSETNQPRPTAASSANSPIAAAVRVFAIAAASNWVSGTTLTIAHSSPPATRKACTTPRYRAPLNVSATLNAVSIGMVSSDCGSASRIAGQTASSASPGLGAELTTIWPWRVSRKPRASPSREPSVTNLARSPREKSAAKTPRGCASPGRRQAWAAVMPGTLSKNGDTGRSRPARPSAAR